MAGMAKPSISIRKFSPEQIDQSLKRCKNLEKEEDSRTDLAALEVLCSDLLCFLVVHLYFSPPFELMIHNPPIDKEPAGIDLVFTFYQREREGSKGGKKREESGLGLCWSWTVGQRRDFFDLFEITDIFDLGKRERTDKWRVGK